MRLVAVSNRVEAAQGAPAAGGLAVALVEALRDHSGLWLGWSGQTRQRVQSTPRIEEAEDFTLATIDLPTADFQGYYNGFANHCLWPLLHFRSDLMEFRRRDYEAYLRVTERFADALLPLLQPDDVLWIHDYHLFLLPAVLRRRGVRNRIGFFLHTPFPPRALLGTLPRHLELARSLFQCDLIGLQTPQDVERFSAYVRHELHGNLHGGTARALGLQVQVEAFPVGIDADHFRELALSPGAHKEYERMRGALRGRQQIIGVDRLDYSKGLLRRLHAFERVLETTPESHGRLDLLQIAPISRGEVKAYRDFRRELEQSAAHINGRFAQVDWTPVRYLNRALPRRVLAGFYRASRVGLVTPMRDGMNLVAKEYVAAQDPADPGVLVLSHFAGAAQQMKEALLVNPYDPDEVAEAIVEACAMPLAERQRRHDSLMAGLRAADITRWQRSFLERLTRRTSGASRDVAA